MVSCSQQQEKTLFEASSNKVDVLSEVQYTPVSTALFLLSTYLHHAFLLQEDFRGISF